DWKYLFTIVPHQLIFDGWSFDVLLGELEAVYKAFLQKRSPTSNLLSFEFRDYTHWCASRDVDRAHLDFHAAALEAGPKTDLFNSTLEQGLCKRREHRYPESTLEQIEVFCAANQLRPHEFLFAAFVKALGQLFNQSEILVGLPVTGRYSADVIGLIGSFVSVLPCQVTIEEGGFSVLVKSISRQLREFHEHQDISYAEVVKGTAMEQQLFPPAMGFSFGFQDIRNRPTALADLKLSQVDIPRKQTEFPIEFWIRIQPNGFVVVFDYDSALVKDEIIDRLAVEISRLFKNIDPLDNQVPDAAVQQTKNKPLWRRLFK
ncbi:MAG: hypothetical protein HKP58_11340, partial [Desulfatitalea sp.]|nr:hypothetical protein [Desulfatitalea sp.]NNK00996.1 hypothetical protein [Desulfatitalea sp.]